MRFFKKTYEYNSVYKDHFKIAGTFFSFLLDKKKSDQFAAGLVIRKKVGKSVLRNKIKRRVKACLRDFDKIYSLQGKAIIIARPESATANWLDIKNDFQDFIKKMIEYENFK